MDQKVVMEVRKKVRMMQVLGLRELVSVIAIKRNK